MISKILTIPKRYYVTALLFVCDLLSGYLFSSMSIIVTDMTSQKRVVLQNGTEKFKTEFEWTSSEVGLLLGINSVGTIFTCFSGPLIHRTGGVTFHTVGKMGETILAFAAPFMVDVHFYLFIGNRFVFGFFEGLSFIGVMDVFARWAPPNERVRLSNFAYLGYGVGSALSYPISGFITQHFGWRYIFYMYSFVILIWWFIWVTLVSKDPSTDKFITEKERMYLYKEIAYIPKDKTDIPYRSILKSVPVYALMNELFIATFTLSFTTMLTLYVKDVYDANIQTVALISGIPELSSLLLRPLFAYCIDYVRSRPNGYSIGKLHKVILFWGQSLTVVFFLICALWNSVTGSVICITLARMSFGLSQVSYTSKVRVSLKIWKIPTSVIVIDVAGQYAGFLQAIVVSVKNLCFFFNSVLIGLMIQDHTRSEWNVYFFLVSFLTMYGVVVFVVFGSGELQPWAIVQPPPVEDKDRDRSLQ